MKTLREIGYRKTDKSYLEIERVRKAIQDIRLDRPDLEKISLAAEAILDQFEAEIRDWNNSK